MLPADSRIVRGESSVLITDLREEHPITGAAGWSEVTTTRIRDVYVNYDHKTPLFKLVTSRGAVLRCTPDQLCFGRINPQIRHYSLYLHERSSMGFRIGVSADLLKDILAITTMKHESSGANELIDRVWIIENTGNLPHATFIHKYAVFKYGLPDIPFSARQADSELSEEMTRQMFNRIDTPKGAHELLRDAHMFIEHPHLTLRVSNSDTPRSSSIQFVIFGGSERGAMKGFSHLIQISGATDPNRAEHRQFKRKQGAHGLWQLEITRDDLEEAELFVKTLSHLDNLEIVKKIQLTRKQPFYVLPASHVKPGMLVPVIGRNSQIEEDTVATVEIEEYKGPLYNLQVHDLHNFIVGNWVVMCYTPVNRLAGD
ncbi:MAG TPA: Hint domain-containing protein [Candidatus Rifleibacterium sp.]|nr:Hint domain-containing protein [Candidatus Rifleibacterium sp.]HPT45642.1 Hint domain-containing protein [Candidatus Rifleibacterium sp.]